VPSTVWSIETVDHQEANDAAEICKCPSCTYFYSSDSVMMLASDCTGTL
jgi:hypothetical protein